MKVVHFINSLTHGGAERLVTDLLPLLKIRGVDVSLISLTNIVPLASNLKENDITLHQLGHAGTMYQMRPHFDAAKKLRRFLATEKPDIIHSHLYLPDIITRLAAPRCVRLISTLHAIDKWWLESYRLRSRGKTLLDALTASMGDVRFIAVSREVKRAACNALHLTDDSVRVIANGIILHKFPLKNKVEIKDAPVIIQIGRFDDQKGHITSLRAFKTVVESYPQARLLFVGEGPLRAAIEAEINKLGLSAQVELLGVRDDIPALLSLADIFWMPSRCEGLGIACIEAMSSGLPVVVSAVGGLTELVSDNKTGCLIDAGNYQQLAQKTLLILSDTTFANQLTSAARKQVENFYSLNITADAYNKAYHDLLESRW